MSKDNPYLIVTKADIGPALQQWMVDYVRAAFLEGWRQGVAAGAAAGAESAAREFSRQFTTATVDEIIRNDRGEITEVIHRTEPVPIADILGEPSS